MVEVRDLRYRYPGAREEALRGLSFDVRAGEIFGFLGPSGAGKSTTQKVLSGLYTGFTGVARVLGTIPGGEAGRTFYQRIGVSFEVPNVYGKLTGRENLEFFRSLHSGPTEDPAALLERVGLAAAADERVSRWSHGMRMRLNFCRALLGRPQLLFLDEPTAGQDPENARRLRQIIRDQRDAGTTVFLSTHDMNVAATLCDRVGFLVDGRIALVDSPGSLMVQHGQRRVRVEFTANGTTASREFELDGLGSNEAFLTLLRDSEIRTLHTLDATLEEVFIRVTGRSLS